MKKVVAIAGLFALLSGVLAVLPPAAQADIDIPAANRPSTDSLFITCSPLLYYTNL